MDDSLERQIRNNTHIDETERRAVINARRGQGVFRTNAESIEERCRVTGITDRRLLRASHIKPWRSCTSNYERLDGYNGLLMAPHVDHIFDKGYISFKDDGQLLVSPRIAPNQFALLGIMDIGMHVGSFDVQRHEYLDFHRKNVFLGSKAPLQPRRT